MTKKITQEKPPSEGQAGAPPLPQRQFSDQEDHSNQGGAGEDEGLVQGLVGAVADTVIPIEPGQYRAGQELERKESGAFGPKERTIVIKEEEGNPDLTRSIDGLIAKAIAPLREELGAKFQALADQVLSIAAERTNGVSAAMVGGVFDCPKCGLRIDGPSMTAQKGLFYVHSFQESPKLGGKQCELKGVQFKAPVAFLEFVKPLTPKAQ